MSWTFCSSGQAIVKAGANANSDIVASNQALADWSDEAEQMINAGTRYDWITNYSSLQTNFKDALQHAATAMIAMNIVNYDMSNYTSRLEAQTMLDVLDEQRKRAMQILEKKENQEKMQ